VVINEFNIMGTVIGPHKANPPLIVDADTVLSLTIALQRPSFDVCPARDGLSVMKRLSVRAQERLDGHVRKLLCSVDNVKQEYLGLQGYA
jgi:hypothetical protein